MKWLIGISGAVWFCTLIVLAFYVDYLGDDAPTVLVVTVLLNAFFGGFAITFGIAEKSIADEDITHLNRRAQSNWEFYEKQLEDNRKLRKKLIRALKEEDQ